MGCKMITFVIEVSVQVDSVLLAACASEVILWCTEDEALKEYTVVNEIIFFIHLIYF